MKKDVDGIKNRGYQSRVSQPQHKMKTSTRPYDICEMVRIAEKFGMNIDTRCDFMLVRSDKTAGSWKIVRTVEEIKEINK